jgi:hypothetical protein
VGRPAGVRRPFPYSRFRSSRARLEVTMKRRVLSLLLLLASCLLPGQFAAAADALTHVPEGAFVVIRFESLDKARGNFKDMLDGIGPAAAPAADGLAEGIAEMLELRGQQEKLTEILDGKSSVHLALFPMFDARQAPTAIFVKVKDDAKLRRALLRVAIDDEGTKIETTTRDDGFQEISREGFDRKFYLGKRDEYVVYTGFEEIVKKLTEKGGKTFADVLDARGLKLLRGGDMAMAVNVAPTVEKHKADLESAREEVNKFIMALPDEQLGTASPEMTKKMYTEAVRYGFNALYDVGWFAGNASFSPQGARAEGLVGVKRFSLTDWVLLANAPAALENLDVLPAAASAYYGLNINPTLMGTFMVEALKMSYGAEVRDREAATKAAEGIAEARLGPTVASFSLPGEDKVGIKTTSITQAGSPRKVTEVMGLLAKALGESDNKVFTQSMDYKAAAEKYKEHVIDLVTIKFKVKDTESIEGQLMDAMLKKFFGGDGLQERLTTFDKLSITVTGNDPKLLERTLEGIADSKDVAGLDKAFGKTRDALGKEANALFMVNAPQIVLDFVGLLKDVPFLGEAIKGAPFNFSLKPPSSFAGVSLATEAQGLRVKAFVPVEQPKAILQIFAPGL